MLKKILIGLPLVLACAVVALQFRRFDPPYPEVHASKDPAVIERGRYLAFSTAHCVECHQANFAGGFHFDTPLGSIHSKNITPDDETGIGLRTDAELARTLRYGVNHKGRALLPFMPFNNISEEDMTAIISFLRSLPPVKNAVPDNTHTLLGYVVEPLLIKPAEPQPQTVKIEVSAAYGEYLTKHMGNCMGCHTKRSPIGEYIGAPFEGGLEMESHTKPGLVLTTPDITARGRIAGWSEDVFVARMHAGPNVEGTPMPWNVFKAISDDDARAIYRYLQSLNSTVATR